MDEKRKKSAHEKAYEKPQLKKVNLVTEEAVLQACKTTSGLVGAWNQNWCASYLVQCFTPNS